MPLVYGPQAFTVGSDSTLQAFDSDFVRVAGSGSDNLIVEADTDRVEAKYSGTIGQALWASYRMRHSAMPDGDQEARGVLRTHGGDGAKTGLFLRRPTDDSDNGYFFCISNNNEMEIIRRVAGVNTQVATGGTIDGDTNYTVEEASAFGTNPVSLTFRITGETEITYDDSNAARFETGTPGVEGRQSGFSSANPCAIDDLEIWDHAAALEGAVTDGIELGDNPASLSIADRARTDGALLGDTPASLSIEVRTKEDGILLGDSLQAFPREARTAQDGIVLGDTPSAATSDQRTPSDGALLGDTPASLTAEDRAQNDGVIFGEDFTISLIEDEAAEGMVLGDSPQSHTEEARTLADGVELGDLPTAELLEALQGIVSDGIRLGDSPVSQIILHIASLTDGIIFGDIPSSEIVYQTVALQDGLIVSDVSVGTLIFLPASLLDGILLGDVPASQVTYDIVSLLDGVKLGDLLAAAAGTVPDLRPPFRVVWVDPDRKAGWVKTL